MSPSHGSSVPVAVYCFMNRNTNRVNYVEQQACVERTVSRLSRVQLWRTSTAVKLLTAVLDIWFTILSGNNRNEADLLTTYTVDTRCLSTDCGRSVGDIKRHFKQVDQLEQHAS
jgi:hypothetical protein